MQKFSSPFKVLFIYTLPFLLFFLLLLIWFVDTLTGFVIFDYFGKISTILMSIIMAIALYITRTPGERQGASFSLGVEFWIFSVLYLGAMILIIFLQKKYPKLNHILFSIAGFIVTLLALTLVFLFIQNR